jgi:hypothetical protein
MTRFPWMRRRTPEDFKKLDTASIQFAHWLWRSLSPLFFADSLGCSRYPWQRWFAGWWRDEQSNPLTLEGGV